MILRCWLVVWVKWARPLSLWHCDPELCSIEKRFNWRTAHFMGRPTPLKVNGANLVPSCPPGVQLLPHFEVWSYRACQPLQMWQISHFLWNPPLWATRRQSFSQCKVNGATLGRSCPPGGATFTPILRYGLTEPASLLKCGKFHILWNPLSELRGVKVFLNVKSMRFFLPLFCPWGKHRTPDRL